MSGLLAESKRQVLPRWLPFHEARSLGQHLCQNEGKLLLRLKNAGQSDLQSAINKWTTDKESRFAAVELLGVSLVLGETDNPSVLAAASYIAEDSQTVPPMAKRLAEMVLADKVITDTVPRHYVQKSKVGSNLAQLKHWTSLYPRNAIAWMDRAFYYVLLGQSRKAEKCVRIALALGASNRFILRASTRFWMHVDRPDVALNNLRRSDLLRVDPWIAGAEVAVSDRAEVHPADIKRARRMLADKSFSPFSVSELAASLATLELGAGARRASKRLLQQALADPTENALAQVEYVARIFEMPIRATQLPTVAPFEARTRSNYREGDFRHALINSVDWYYFQPFESRSAVFATYIASTCVEEYDVAIEIAKSAMDTSAENFAVLNNLIFALARADRVDEARLLLPRALAWASDSRLRAVMSATEGAVWFRAGRWQRGRTLYRKAVEQFREIRDSRAEGIALWFWSQEETRIGSEKAPELKHLAISRLNAAGVTEISLH